jgi:putative ABC transport system permease protein
MTRGPKVPRRLFSGEPRREVQDELEFHLEKRAQEYMAAGLDEQAARRAALERIGDFDRVRSECTDLLVSERRSHARRDWFSDLHQDVRFAVRTAARAPLFTLMAVLTLALGIGANSAIFGVVKSVILNALPYGEPERLVRVQARFANAPDLGGPLSAGTVHDITERQRSFASVAASISGGPDAVLQAGDAATTVRLARVQPGYFHTLGVDPVIGRSFDDADISGDTARVVVMTHEMWRQQFAGDPNILGRAIVVNGIPRTVLGVLPRDFLHPVQHADFFMPFDLEPLLRDPVAVRGSHYLELVARLKPGVPLVAAQAEVSALGTALAREYPRDNEGLGLEAQRLQDTMMGDTRTPLLVLMASAGLVLLIACANLAGALLSRTITRRKEFAVRISLGAGQGRLVRQLLAESVLLAAAGGAAGLLLANTGLAALRSANIDTLPDYANLSLDVGAVAFTFVLALMAGTAFGLAPALSVGRAQPQPMLRDESRGATESRGAGRLRGLLVAGQVALCLGLLAGAGLLARSLWVIASAPLGFDANDALVFDVPLSGSRYPTAEARIAFRDEMAPRIRALPGVTAVTIARFVPTRVTNSNGVSVVGAERAAASATPFVLTSPVTENFFEMMRIPLVAGRTFSTADHLETPGVIVVNETMARIFWPNGDAVGARVRLGPNPESTPFEVIGVVRDARTNLATTETEPLLYTSLRQGWPGATFIVRTAGNPLRYANTVRRELATYDRALPMANVTTLRDVIDSGLAPRRLPMLLMLTFAALALLLACIGIYALFASMALAREREFGVRMALGSTRAAVAALVLRQGALWMLIGIAGGAVGIFAVSRALRGIIYGIQPLDHVSIAAAIGALLLCAFVALAVPVRRATRADPLSVMR